ncbi:MAG: hypothetical protein Q8R96_01595 [Bacteroidota bacterium]|nr:hypothetical protein [Bacteroidota bacterium]
MKYIILVLWGSMFHNIAFSQNIGRSDSILFRNAVQVGIEKYLNKIPIGKEKDFGFNTREEFGEVLVGDSFQNYNFRDYSFSDTSKTNLFEPINTWSLPLIINNKYRCFVDIELTNDGYKAIGFGLPVLASDMDDFENCKHMKNIKSKALFIDYALNVYCIVTSDANNNLNFWAFRPINQCGSNNLENKDKYSSTEIVEILKIKNKKLKHEL